MKRADRRPQPAVSGRGAQIQPTVYRRPTAEQGFGLVGAIVLSTTLLIIATALMTVVLSGYRYQHRAYLGAKATSIAEGGADFAIYKLNQAGSTYSGESGTSFGGGTYDVTVTEIDASTKQITVAATVRSGVLPITRRVRVTVSGTPSDQAAFNYGVQVGNGGLDMQNGATIVGNVYSNGNASGLNTAYIKGDIWVAGPTGTISGFSGPGGLCNSVNFDKCGIQKSSATATDGNARAHTITGSEIGRDAYYQSISGSTVAGTSHPGSSDPAPTSFAITTEQIDSWKALATEGGTQVGNVTQSSGTVTMGPRKIVGDITLSGTAVLNLTGTLYVTGRINASNSAIIQVDPSFGVNGTHLISDGPFTIQNSAIFRGSGNPKSYLLAISTSSADPAMLISNSVKNDILFAPNGWVQIENFNEVREVTAYGLRIKNSAIVRYDQGLASASFSSGPGGRWSVTSWQRLK